MGPGEIHVPTFIEMYRMAPISVWSVSLVALGYYFGRRSCQAHIALLERVAEVRHDARGR